MRNLANTYNTYNDIKTTTNVSRIGVRSSNNGGFWMTPIFASGQVLISSLLDNVLFQAYSKTHILDLIKLCCGVRFKQAIELDQMLGIDCSNICLIDAPDEYIVRFLQSKALVGTQLNFFCCCKGLTTLNSGLTHITALFSYIGKIVFEIVPRTGLVVRNHPLGLVPCARPRIEQCHAVRI